LLTFQARKNRPNTRSIKRSKLAKPAQKEALRLAQLEWIKYRDLDFKLIDSIYDSMQGTMYIPMRIDARMEVIKKRALELKGYLDLVQEGGE
jgi:uncharacterized protein YecT (DUF1311 family)